MQLRDCLAPVLLTAALASGITAERATAQGMAPLVMNPGIFERIPARGVSKKSGLFVEVQDDGLGTGQFGYRRLFFRIHSPKPFTADTQVTVEANVGGWSRSHNTTTVEVDGELQRGQTSGTIVVRVPQTSEWRMVWWDVWIDGVHDSELSKPRYQVHFVNNNDSSRWQSASMVELRLTGDDESATQTSERQLAASRSGRSGVELQSIAGGPRENWLDYTPFDFVRLDLAKLESLPQDDPDGWQALRKWTHAGGLLWIENVGDDWERLDRVHPLFGWRPDQAIEPAKPQAGEAPWKTGWSYVDLSRQASGEDGLVENYGRRRFDSHADAEETRAADYSDDMFVLRQFGFGRVIASPEGAFRQPHKRGTGYRAGQYWLQQEWPRRHGLMPGIANDDFSNWLIPDVGLAPVVSFQVLITLFVIAIGPANYWLLKRAGRLHLLVVTVPVAALSITLALLAYGILSDGIATQLRARSLTLLDQREGRGTTWSRLSYYAALAPHNGLTFSDEAAVYPIAPGSIEAYDVEVAQRDRKLTWLNDQQQLHSGWLASRTPTQLLVIEPRHRVAGLAIDLSAERESVTNGFESQAVMLAVIDGDGNWFWAEAVQPQATASLTPIERTEAIARLRERLADSQPEFPPGFEAAEDSPLLYDRQRQIRRYYRRYGGEVRLPGMREGQLHREWQQLLGLSGTPAFDLPPSSYVLLAERAPLPASGDDFPIETSSIHMVIGRW